MRRIGIDGHVLTGKYQGSRTYLEGMLAAIGAIDPANRYIIYSEDPADVARRLNFPNFEHRTVPSRRAMVRLSVGWPFVQLRDRLDFLLTNFISPLVFARRQLVVVHDVLFESHPFLFPRGMRLRNQLLVRLSARRAHSVLTPSLFSRDEVIRRYRLPPERVLVTRNAVTLPPPPDPQAEQAALTRLLGPAPRAPYALFVGRLEPRKNLGLLLAAWRERSDRSAELVVVGKADFGAAATLAALRAEPTARHLEDVAEPDLRALYRHAAMLVFPSAAEGFGLPILEALQVGTPVIHADSGAMLEVGGGFTRMFDPSAPGATATLAGLIDQTLAAPRPDPSEALRRHLAQFDWRQSARVLVDLVNADSGARPS